MGDERERFVIVRIRETTENLRILGTNLDRRRGLLDFYAILDTSTFKTYNPGPRDDRLLKHLEELNRVHGR